MVTNSIVLLTMEDTTITKQREIKEYELNNVKYNNGVRYEYTFGLPSQYLLTEFELHSEIIPVTVLYTYNGLLAAQGECSKLNRWNFSIKMPGLYFSKSEIIIRTIEKLQDDVFITIYGDSTFKLKEGLDLSLHLDSSMKLIKINNEDKFRLVLGKYRSDCPGTLDTEVLIKEVTFSNHNGFSNNGSIINDPKYKIEQIKRLT